MICLEAYVGMKLSFKISGYECEGEILDIEYREHYDLSKTNWLTIYGVREDGKECGLLIMERNLKEYIIERELNNIEQLSLF